jgi:peroxiredoxin Q/BCP
MMVDVGELAPDFELTSDTGKGVSLSGFRGQKIILYFYPKALTKG